MPMKPPTLRPAHAIERGDQRRRYDAQRRAAEPWRKWYGLAVWTKQLRKAQLLEQPRCERCAKAGRDEPATVVNHREPHEGDWARFVDADNHESLCKFCHDRDAQRDESAARKAKRST